MKDTRKHPTLQTQPRPHTWRVGPPTRISWSHFDGRFPCEVWGLRVLDVRFVGVWVQGLGFEFLGGFGFNGCRVQAPSLGDETAMGDIRLMIYIFHYP